MLSQIPGKALIQRESVSQIVSWDLLAAHLTWSINPEKYANGKCFNVFAGDQQRPARILGDDEEKEPADRHLVHRVPRGQP